MLSDREVEILTYLSRGYTAKEVGTILYLSPLTVKELARRARVKLGAKNTLHAVMIAVQKGYIPLD